MNLEGIIYLCMLASGYKGDKRSMFIQSFWFYLHKHSRASGMTLVFYCGKAVELNVNNWCRELMFSSEIEH